MGQRLLCLISGLLLLAGMAYSTPVGTTTLPMSWTGIRSDGPTQIDDTAIATGTITFASGFSTVTLADIQSFNLEIAVDDLDAYGMVSIQDFGLKDLTSLSLVLDPITGLPTTGGFELNQGIYGEFSVSTSVLGSEGEGSFFGGEHDIEGYMIFTPEPADVGVFGVGLLVLVAGAARVKKLRQCKYESTVSPLEN